MSKNSRVHHERGFTMKRGAAEKGEREGNLVWIGHDLIRDATADEIFESMTKRAAERVRAIEVLGRNDTPGLRFERPKTTNYQQPWRAYEEMDSPMGVRYCRWPRRLAA